MSKGLRLSGLTGEVIDRQSVEEWIRKIFDQPSIGPYRPKDQVSNTEERPYYNAHEVSHAPFYAWKFWEPSAINFRGKYFRGYNDEWHALVEELPKIPDEEAGLLFDLICKILVYEPAERLCAKEILSHPWFSMDDRT